MIEEFRQEYSAVYYFSSKYFVTIGPAVRL